MTKRKPRGRPKAAEQLKPVSTRIPADMFERVEAYAERIKQENPGRLATVSDAIRELVFLGLRAVEERDREGGTG